MIEKTLERIYALRLKSFGKALEDQLHRGQASDLSFEERLALLIDSEWDARQSRRTDRRLHEAKLKHGTGAEGIDFRYPRGLDKSVVLDLLNCAWVRAGRNVILTGATGLGKTWIACALADRACREGFSAIYYRVPRLLQELALARADGSYLKQLGKMSRTDLLVLDDWGLAPLDGAGQHDLLEVIDDRAGQRSTLVTSQLPIPKWHGMVTDPSVADAMLDRIIGASVQIALKGESIRKNKGR